MARPITVQFLGNAIGGGSATFSFTVPPNVYKIFAEMCGGGAGGGSGNTDASFGTDRWTGGGSGVGGSSLVSRWLDVVPGDVISGIVGDGGAGGGYSGSGSLDGADGTDSVLTISAVELLRAPGAGHGWGGSAATSSTARFGCAGGKTCKNTSDSQWMHKWSWNTTTEPAVILSAIACVSPGQGGWAQIPTDTDLTIAGTGGRCAQGSFGSSACDGGAPGTKGTDDGSYRGGGQGGGGGAGPFGGGGGGGGGGGASDNGGGAGAGGTGGVGGGGGAGDGQDGTAGTGVLGGTGGDAGHAANGSGAGGGGGAGNGHGTAANGSDGAGGNGGSGRVRLTYFR